MVRKMLLTAALMAAFIAAPTLADEDRGHHKRSMNLDYIFNQLNLSEEDQSEVKDVLKQFKKEKYEAMRAHHKSGEGRPGKEEMSAMKQEHKTELRSRLTQVLAKDQVEELMTYMEAHRPAKHHRHHEKAGKHHDHKRMHHKKEDR